MVSLSRYDRLMNRISNGERILIDGATGSEIERRGVPQLENAWNAGGALSHPDVLREVHEDYIRAGATVVISNTFATHRQALRSAGVEDHFTVANRRGIELALEARERTGAQDVLVAGGISYWSWSGDWTSSDELLTSVEEQASIMADAGADFLMLEMMIDIERMLVSLDAAQKCGLPVWVGLSCKPADSDSMILLGGDLLADALDVLADKNVPVVSIMHTEVAYIDACLDVVGDHWSGPVGVYAHAARLSQSDYAYDTSVSPDDYVSHSERWFGRGVQVIGTCCGFGVDYIRALKSKL